MNKVISIALLGLACASVRAEEPNTRLEQISKAIAESDLVRVKTLWRRLDSSIEKLDEKETVLKSLIKEASELEEDSKTTPGIGGGRNYKLLAAGVALYAVSLGSVIAARIFLLDGAQTQSQTITGLAVTAGGIGLAYYSGTLLRDGWNGGSVQIAAGGRSKAKIVAAYLESRLQELHDELAAQKKSNKA